MKIRIGKKHQHEVLIDDADYELVSQYKWGTTGSKNHLYASTWVGRVVLMHRLLLSVPDGKCVDHINGNGLDNRRCNLRICEQSENLRNRRKLAPAASRFKGVQRSRGRWRARIGAPGNRVSLGHFADEVQAARAYDRAALSMYGEFAKTNEMLGLFFLEAAE